MDGTVYALFGLQDEKLARLIYLFCLLLLVAGGLSFVPGRLFRAIKQAAIWFLIIAALVVLYTYREPLLRAGGPVLSELQPGRVAVIVDENNRKSLVFSRGSDGHFHVIATIDGAQIDFLVDTGATGTVLSYRDAVRAGIDIGTLNFSNPVQTANGVASLARADIGALSIGPFKINRPSVGVLQKGKLDGSLLGLDVLNRFTELKIEGDRLTLMP
ncbi:MAG: retropepsin-like aspartic protease family protein [Alphaproteobacteria bacterium]